MFVTCDHRFLGVLLFAGALACRTQGGYCPAVAPGDTSHTGIPAQYGVPTLLVVFKKSATEDDISAAMLHRIGQVDHPPLTDEQIDSGEFESFRGARTRIHGRAAFTICFSKGGWLPGREAVKARALADPAVAAVFENAIPWRIARNQIPDE